MPKIVQRKFSLVLRIATHIGALLPLLVLVLDFQNHRLTENPIQAAEQRTGTIALVLLLLSLACTPLNTLFRFSWAIQRRRALGLYAFFYASLHLFIFTVVDYGLDWSTLWQMLSEKRYIVVGLAAFTILVALAATSFRRSMKRMGKSWKRLHQLVYLAGALVILHFAWVVKGNVTSLNGDVLRPVLYGAALALLLAMRIPAVRKAIVRARQQILTRPPTQRPRASTHLMIDKP